MEGEREDSLFAPMENFAMVSPGKPCQPWRVPEFSDQCPDPNAWPAFVRWLNPRLYSAPALQCSALSDRDLPLIVSEVQALLVH